PAAIGSEYSRILQLRHVSIDQVQVTALLSRDTVKIFKFPDVIGAHPAVLAGCSIAIHPALVISTEQTIHVKLDKISSLLRFREKHTVDGLFPTDDPRFQRVFHKLQRLLLNIRKARLFQIPDHVRRYPENSSNLINLKFSCFQKLCLLRGDGDWRILHPFLQNSNL